MAQEIPAEISAVKLDDWFDSLNDMNKVISGKPITLIGMAFSTKKRAVSGVKIVRDA